MLEEQLIEAQAKIKQRIRELILPLFVFTLGAFGVLFFSIWQNANLQDEHEIEASEALFGALIKDQIDRIKVVALDVTFWDAAVKNLVVDLNPDWAAANVGAYLHDVYGFSGSYVIDDDNNTVYASEYSNKVDISLFQKFSGIEKTLKSLRENYSYRQENGGISEFRIGSDGQGYIVAAAVINPDFSVLVKEDVADLLQTRHVLFLTKAVDEAYLMSLSEQYAFSKINFFATEPRKITGASYWEFLSLEGQPVGWAVWQKDLHGTELLNATFKNISMVIVALLGLMVFIAYRGMSLGKIIDRGIVDYVESKKITLIYERAISDLGHGPSLYDLSLSEAFHKIAVNAVQTMGIDQVGLWKFDEDSGFLTNVFCHDVDEGNKETGVSFPISDFIKSEGGYEEALNFCVPNIWDVPTLSQLGHLCLDPDTPVSMLGIPIIRHRKKMGLVYFSVKNSEFDWTDENRRFAHTISDFVSLIFEVQSQKNVEIELRTSKNKAEMANIAKGEFLANMSHELRTPLNAVIGFSDLMKQKIYGDLGSEKYTDYVEDINLSARHLLSLINEILDVSKIDAGTYSIYPVDIDVVQELENARRLLKGRFKERIFNVDVAIEESVRVISADPKCFRQIILNILVNAIKFCEGDCHIFIRGIAASGHLQLSFKDNGIGIAADKLADIFTPFHQLENALTKRFEGTGLGLSITQALVELHHGTISVESEPGSGTTITITLPVAQLSEK